MKKFREAEALNSVAKFHNTFQAPVLKTPQIPASDRCKLRVSLLEEEVKELKEAIAQNDLVEIADALADIQYVLSGAILEFGMAEKFNDLFSEVQRSNMSKACITMEEAKQTVERYHQKDGTESKIVEKDGVFLVMRKTDNKILKSVNYSPADLKSIL